MSNDIELVTQAEIARRFGVSRALVNKWARLGWIVPVQGVTGVRVFVWADVAEWRAERFPLI